MSDYDSENSDESETTGTEDFNESDEIIKDDFDFQ